MISIFPEKQNVSFRMSCPHIIMGIVNFEASLNEFSILLCQRNNALNIMWRNKSHCSFLERILNCTRLAIHCIWIGCKELAKKNNILKKKTQFVFGQKYQNIDTVNFQLKKWRCTPNEKTTPVFKILTLQERKKIS